MESSDIPDIPGTPLRLSPGSMTNPPLSPSMRSPGMLESPGPNEHGQWAHEPNQFGSPLRSPLPSAAEDVEMEDEEPPEPRLVIRKLVLINYKSYAGRQEIGPFNENFTAVVGPNGSGKSNVIDSLLFAFGFRAKKMRQDKLTGLIHRSENNPNLGFARVEIHFETVGEPDSELRLAREVRRDGSNFYAINEKRHSYAEVAQLLEARGIDLRHKRFLILQGEVESISLMPPKADGDGSDGLLEYLEDIIGTSRYQGQIDDMVVRSEVLREDFNAKRDVTEFLETEVRQLDKKRAEMEQFMVRQNAATMARSSLYQLYAYRLGIARASSTADVADVERELKASVAAIAQKRAAIAERQKESAKHEGEVQKMKKELAAAKDKVKMAKVTQVQLQQRAEQRKKNLKKAERDLSQARSEKNQAETWLRNFEKDSEALQARHTTLAASEQGEKRVLEEMQRELQGATKGLQDEIQQLQTQAEPWREKIAAKQQEIAAIDAAGQRLRTQVEEMKGKEAVVKEHAEEMIATGTKTDALVKELDARLQQLTAEQQQVATDLAQGTEAQAKAAKTLETLRPEVAAAQQARQSSQNRNYIERRLMSLKIPGLYGRLGSLGTIDDKYDVAVSTAGPELNNFVVKDVETAKRCLDELRKHSIGRAKFMVLDKLSTPRQASPSEFPAPRLQDLVKPLDPSFQKAFASALGDTLVVDTPENGSRVAFGGKRRFRVVTLAGMVFNSSGQMSGGGKPPRGYMSGAVAAVSVEDLDALEKRLRGAEMDLAEARTRVAALQERKEELEAALPRARSEAERETRSLEVQKTKMLEIRERRRGMKQEIRTLEERSAAYDAEAVAKKAPLEEQRREFEAESKPFEDGIQKLQADILNVGGLRFREQKSKVRNLEDNLAHIQTQLSEGRQKTAQEMSKAKKMTADIAALEKEIETLSAEQSVVPEEVKLIPAFETRVNELSALLQKHANDMEALKEAVNVIRAEIEQARAKEEDLHNRLKKSQASLVEQEASLKAIQEDLASLQLHDVSEARSLDRDVTPAIPTPANDVEMGSRPTTADFAEAKAAILGLTADDSQPGSTEDDAEMDLHNLPAGSAILPDLSPDEIEGLDEAALKRDIRSADADCSQTTLDMDVIRRYQEKYHLYAENRAISDQALSDFDRVKEEAENLKRRRHTEFMTGFKLISSKLKELYQLITLGGNAELELVDSLDPFSEGILFSVMPPKKSWRNISNLSGGEKTLSSLALVFALHHYKPTPLYVMDEIDAALDFRNVSIIANYIKERTKNGQFIVISLRNNMFELASRLVGVYKVENMSRSVTLQID